MPSGSIDKVSTGLIFYDDFNRADSATVGNGWSEVGNVELKDNSVVLSGGGNSQCYRSSPSETINGIRQINVSSSTTPFGMAVFTTDHTVVGSSARGGHLHGCEPRFLNPGNPDNNSIRLQRPWVALDDRAPFSVTTSSLVTLRLIVSESAVRGYGKINIASTQSLNEDIGTGSYISATRAYGPDQYGFGALAASVQRFDQYIVTNGQFVVVGGLETGYTARLMGGAPVTRSAVAESAGTSSIQITTEAMPFDRLEILSASVVVSAFESASGIWPGDVYNFAPFVAPPMAGESQGQSELAGTLLFNPAGLSGISQAPGAIASAVRLDFELIGDIQGRSAVFAKLSGVTQSIADANSQGQSVAAAQLQEIPEILSGISQGQSRATAILTKTIALTGIIDAASSITSPVRRPSGSFENGAFNPILLETDSTTAPFDFVTAQTQSLTLTGTTLANSTLLVGISVTKTVWIGTFEDFISKVEINGGPTFSKIHERVNSDTRGLAIYALSGSPSGPFTIDFFVGTPSGGTGSFESVLGIASFSGSANLADSVVTSSIGNEITSSIPLELSTSFDDSLIFAPVTIERDKYNSISGGATIWNRAIFGVMAGAAGYMSSSEGITIVRSQFAQDDPPGPAQYVIAAYGLVEIIETFSEGGFYILGNIGFNEAPAFGQSQFFGNLLPLSRSLVGDSVGQSQIAGTFVITSVMNEAFVHGQTQITADLRITRGISVIAQGQSAISAQLEEVPEALSGTAQGRSQARAVLSKVGDITGAIKAASQMFGDLIGIPRRLFGIVQGIAQAKAFLKSVLRLGAPQVNAQARAEALLVQTKALAGDSRAGGAAAAALIGIKTLGVTCNGQAQIYADVRIKRNLQASTIHGQSQIYANLLTLFFADTRAMSQVEGWLGFAAKASLANGLAPRKVVLPDPILQKSLVDDDRKRKVVIREPLLHKVLLK